MTSLARNLIADHMREDPALLSRPTMDILSENVVAIDEAVLDVPDRVSSYTDLT